MLVLFQLWRSFLQLIGGDFLSFGCLCVFFTFWVVFVFWVLFIAYFWVFFPALLLLPPINWRANWRRGRRVVVAAVDSPTVSILKQSPFKISFRLFTNTHQLANRHYFIS